VLERALSQVDDEEVSEHDNETRALYLVRGR
jgi:hypothetical protein